VEKSLTVENELVLSWGFSKMELSFDPRHRYQTLRVFLDGNNRVRNYVIVGDVGLPPTAK